MQQPSHSCAGSRQERLLHEDGCCIGLLDTLDKQIHSPGGKRDPGNLHRCRVNTMLDALVQAAPGRSTLHNQMPSCFTHGTHQACIGLDDGLSFARLWHTRVMKEDGHTWQLAATNERRARSSTPKECKKQ